MKICFLAPANSAHTKKWCSYFVSRGHEVHVVSFTEDRIEGVQVHLIRSGTNGEAEDLDKLKYLLQAGKVKKEIRQIRPDILNVHYATSYGTVAALAGIGPYILSVWGSDIFDFPKRSSLHRKMLEFSLQKADILFSTSRAMAQEAAAYTKKQFYITPFGVDTELFSPEKRIRRKRSPEQEKEAFIVGTVKGLDYKYGIDYLLKAAAILVLEHPEIPLKLRIAGKGPHEEQLKQLAEDLKIGDRVTWLGFISQENAAAEWADFDLGICYSNCNESFGVAAVEAQACECPLIISDVAGLMEAADPGVTSEVVERADEQKLAAAILNLYADPDRRLRMGKAGREYVLSRYEYSKCFSDIEQIFETNRKR